MRPHHRTTAIVFALVAVVFGVFFRTLESGFLRWDDDINVFENPHVQGLTAENLRWMFTDFEQAIRYKPLSWLAWALVHEVFGLNPSVTTSRTCCSTARTRCWCSCSSDGFSNGERGMANA